MQLSSHRKRTCAVTRNKQDKPIRQLTAAQFDKLFPNEDACSAYLVARRWPEGVRCPRCGNTAVYDLPSRKWHWQCTKCAPGGSTGYRFSHTVGTIFENTNKPLKDWFRVIHLMLVSKKGMSALQIYRFLGFGSYKTAWTMCHKIRTALIEDIGQLAGVVEVDETFVGGKAKNRHWDKRGDGTGGTGDRQSNRGRRCSAQGERHCPRYRQRSGFDPDRVRARGRFSQSQLALHR